MGGDGVNLLDLLDEGRLGLQWRLHRLLASWHFEGRLLALKQAGLIEKSGQTYRVRVFPFRGEGRL